MMNNDVVQWSPPKYFKENNNNNKIDKHKNKCKNNNKYIFCCQTNNNKYNNNTNQQINNNKNKVEEDKEEGEKGSEYKNLDNKKRNVSNNNYNNSETSTSSPYAAATAEQSLYVNIAAEATKCDRKFFDRIPCNPCNCAAAAQTIEFSDSNTRQKATTTKIDTFRSIPSVKSDCFVSKSTSRVDAAISYRTFYARKGNAILAPSSFYRILFLCLQLSAALLSFTHNIGFALGSNVLNKFDDSDVGEVDNNIGHFTHTWAVHIPNGEENGLANRVARDHGFINRGKIFDDHYHFEHHKVSKRSLSPSDEHQLRLDDDSRVNWSKQQRAKSRQKRDFIRLRPSRTSSRALSLVDAVILNDPKWPQMWYLNRGGGLDMNVIPAWKEGITGKGIVVTILDDGLESDHPDIEHNYDPLASYDVNSHDDDPMPHYDMTDSNRHGTRCAGEVAATANNSICAVGIAFGASVGGVRMLDGDVTDAVEARSLSLNPQHIDIYSASWGPDDDGKTVDGPGELASRAFIEGVTKGRNGKGSIFIWASGNGGRELDNCNCDGYTNSIWTLSISSATEDGHVPWYSEKCSSTLATTYSSGGQGEKQVVTTDLHHSCTVSHTGTSASAPLAAGIAALVLESNNNLTWRDLQHIVVRTAKPANLKDPTWSKNGVGRRISHSFGYGLMDAAAMVRVARTWKTVPEQQRCEINAPHVDKTIPPEGYITLQLAVKHCMSVNYLEHVQAKITLTSQRRGDIQLYLKSPAGTRVTLLTSRVHDNSRTGFNQWPFMSVHTWGESPHGNWQLEIHNQGRYKAQITQWDLIFYGTEIPAQPEDTAHFGSGKYDSFGGEMEHNDIEFDASGQWRNMQQVGESAVKSHDRTSTACTKTTIDQRCLDCAPPTFLFNDRCYDECPRHTYIVISEPTTPIDDLHTNSISKVAEDQEQLLSTDKRRKRNRLVDATNDSKSQQRECRLCDSSCYQCYGPLNSQCSTCYPGSQLRRQQNTNETYCNVFAERSTGIGGSNGEISDVTYNTGNEPFISLRFLLSGLGVIAFVVCLVVITNYRSMRCMNNANDASDKALYSYDRVALLEEAEHDLEAPEIHNEVAHKKFNEQNSKVLPQTPYSLVNNADSESEEEIDLFSKK